MELIWPDDWLSRNLSSFWGSLRCFADTWPFDGFMTRKWVHRILRLTCSVRWGSGCEEKFTYDWGALFSHSGCDFVKFSFGLAAVPFELRWAICGTSTDLSVFYVPSISVPVVIMQPNVWKARVVVASHLDDTVMFVPYLFRRTA